MDFGGGGFSQNPTDALIWAVPPPSSSPPTPSQDGGARQASEESSLQETLSRLEAEIERWRGAARDARLNLSQVGLMGAIGGGGGCLFLGFFWGGVS